jgi:hypothetical protein
MIYYTSEPAYQIQCGGFILSFYPDELKSRATIRTAAEEHLLEAYSLRHMAPPTNLDEALDKIVEQVVTNMGVA